jgi:hypothetical protein
MVQTRAAAQAAPPATVVIGAERASRRSVPAGQVDQRASRHAERISFIADSASPSPVLSQPA